MLGGISGAIGYRRELVVQGRRVVQNLSAAVLFLFIAEVAWAAAGLLALGSIIGGQLGARVGRRLPPTALRVVIVLVGLAAIAKLLFD